MNNLRHAFGRVFFIYIIEVKTYMNHFYVKKCELLNNQTELIQELEVYGFTGSTEIRDRGEHIFGRSYTQERYDDARFRPERFHSVVCIWNNGMKPRTFAHLRTCFNNYMNTYNNTIECVNALKAIISPDMSSNEMFVRHCYNKPITT